MDLDGSDFGIIGSSLQKSMKRVKIKQSQQYIDRNYSLKKEQPRNVSAVTTRYLEGH